MTFEEFIPAFNEWYAEQGLSAFLVGIRAGESLNRFRAIKRANTNRRHFEGKKWSTQSATQGFNLYPLYDWRTEDVWKYLGSTGEPYNRVYDLMYLAGMGIHEMRICEPYSREARKNLDKYHKIEPETWDRIVERAGGINFGALVGDTELFGYRQIKRPEGMTWKEYAYFLLGTLPVPLRKHYERRIGVFVGWFRKNLGWTDLKEESDLKLEMRNLGGSWRMVCRTLLKNDYFCSHLSFSINKQEFEKYKQLEADYHEANRND